MLLKSSLIILAIILLVIAGLFSYPLFINDRELNKEKPDAPLARDREVINETGAQTSSSVINKLKEELLGKTTEEVTSDVDVIAEGEQEMAEQEEEKKEAEEAVLQSEPDIAQEDNIKDNVLEVEKIKYKKVLTTVFWVGEEETADNGYIHNSSSAWNTYWEKSYGGVDDPDDRCGYRPCAFTPRENPFYFALPYDDFYDEGGRKESAKDIPWYYEAGEYESLLKNRWIEVKYSGRSCYAQWEDVGPFESDDFAYVFGNSLPKNTDGLKAGLDVSPALEDCLSFDGAATVEWRFVRAEEVPDGPWTEIITTSGVAW